MSFVVDAAKRSFSFFSPSVFLFIFILFRFLFAQLLLSFILRFSAYFTFFIQDTATNYDTDNDQNSYNAGYSDYKT